MEQTSKVEESECLVSEVISGDQIGISSSLSSRFQTTYYMNFAMVMDAALAGLEKSGHSTISCE